MAAVEVLPELVSGVVLTPAPDHWDVVVEGRLGALVSPGWGGILVPQKGI